jgi:hypothetical protein
MEAIRMLLGLIFGLSLMSCGIIIYYCIKISTQLDDLIDIQKRVLVDIGMNVRTIKSQLTEMKGKWK